MASFQHQQPLISQVKNSAFYVDDNSIFDHLSFPLCPKCSKFLITQSFVPAFITLPLGTYLSALILKSYVPS